MNLEKTIKNLESRGFMVSHFTSAEDAAAHIAGLINGKTVGIGGSKTIEALGLYEKLSDKGKACLTPVMIAAVLILSTAYLVDATYNPFLYFRF